MPEDAFKTLKELDEALGQPKGTAFRWFKQHLQTLTEGQDFQLLDAVAQSQDIAALKALGRVYRQSRNVVLLSPACYLELQADYQQQRNLHK